MFDPPAPARTTPRFTPRAKTVTIAVAAALAGAVAGGTLTAGLTSSPDLAAQCRAVVGASPTPLRRLSDWGRTCADVDAWRPPAPAPTTARPRPSTAAPSTSGQPTPTPTVPPGQGWPDASNTGWRPTGAILKPYTGSLTLWAANTTLDSVLIVGDVCILGNGIRISRSQITGTVTTGSGTPFGPCTGVDPATRKPMPAPSGVVLSDVTVLGPGVATGQTVNIAATFALSVDGLECNRCDISRWGSGVYVHQNVLVQNSWIHELVGYKGCSPILGPDCLAHRSGIGGNGAVNARYVHNTVQANSLNGVPGISGAIVVYSQAGFLPARDVLVKDNLLTADGASYCLYAGIGDIAPTGVTVAGNRFARGESGQCGLYGPLVGADTGVTYTDNTYTDGGAITW